MTIVRSTWACLPLTVSFCKNYVLGFPVREEKDTVMTVLGSQRGRKGSKRHDEFIKSRFEGGKWRLESASHHSELLLKSKADALRNKLIREYSFG